LASWIRCETEDLNLIMESWVFESFCFWIGFYAPRQTEFSPCSQWYLIPEMVFNQILRFFPGLRSVHFKHLNGALVGAGSLWPRNWNLFF
jgi:hypothetical protein